MLAILSLVYLSFLLQYARTQKFGDAELVYEWKWLEFDWPSEAEKQKAIDSGDLIPERNLLSGVKVYNRQVYITIPRRKWTSGHPVSLAKVVMVDGQSKLRPYPNWAAQKQGDCNGLQFAQGMEIDPNTGLMYVIDTGRVGLTLNLCPAKIVVYDLKTDKQVGQYVLPGDVVNRTSNFLNDLVLDYVDGKVRYAYITDTNDASIVVYDFQEGSTHKLRDPSMKIEPGNATIITINGIQYDFPIAVNGIAMSPDFKYVYYCVLGGYKLFQVPTSTLRNPHFTGNTKIRSLGIKASQTDGMIYGRDLLYYGAMGLNAIYFWNASADMASRNVGMDSVTLETQKVLVRNDSKMQWPSTLAFDEEGWLWISCNRLQVFWNKESPPDDGEAYMRIWKVFVNETGYLYKANSRTMQQNNGCTLLSPNLMYMSSVVVLAFVSIRFHNLMTIFA